MSERNIELVPYSMDHIAWNILGNYKATIVLVTFEKSSMG